MQASLVIGFFGLLVWVVFIYGIEPALALGSLITGLVWLFYRIGKGKAEGKVPLTVEYARSFFPIFLIVLLLRGFLVEPFRIPSGSMLPTLENGDFILVNKFSYGLRLPLTKTKIMEIGQPQRGDIMVFRYPLNTRVDFIKRAIGLPGDKVRYKDKHLYINGEMMPIEISGAYQPNDANIRALGSLIGKEQLEGVEHPVLINPMRPDFDPASCTFLKHDEVTIPEGHYLMMGDNRDDSSDGRCWGFVPEENIVGKAFFIWMNWDIFGTWEMHPSRIGSIYD